MVQNTVFVNMFCVARDLKSAGTDIVFPGKLCFHAQVIQKSDDRCGILSEVDHVAGLTPKYEGEIEVPWRMKYGSAPR